MIRLCRACHSKESLAVPELCDSCMQPLAPKSCATCRFYAHNHHYPEGTDAGNCRRKSPREFGWPVVGLVDWCGKWESKS